MKKTSIVAVCGSTRKKSNNLKLLKAIQHLAAPLFDICIFEGLAELPQFIPDTEAEPENVSVLKNMLKAADGILISSPEYVLGVPGALKNMIDWTVNSMEFRGKPLGLITAAASGKAAHRSLLATLLILEAKITQQTQIQIPGIQTKISAEGLISDSETLKTVNSLINSLYGMIRDESAYSYLPVPEVC